MMLHAQVLTKLGEHARAVSLLTQALQHNTARHGEEDVFTVRVAVNLGQVQIETGRPTEAVQVCERAWRIAGRCMPGDHEIHIFAFEVYLDALRLAKDVVGVLALLEEAKARGLPQGTVNVV